MIINAISWTRGRHEQQPEFDIISLILGDGWKSIFIQGLSDAPRRSIRLHFNILLLLLLLRLLLRGRCCWIKKCSAISHVTWRNAHADITTGCSSAPSPRHWQRVCPQGYPTHSPSFVRLCAGTGCGGTGNVHQIVINITVTFTPARFASAFGTGSALGRHQLIVIGSYL